MQRALLAALLAVLFVSWTGQAAASHVRCGDTLTRDTTLDSDLVQCFDGLRIGADGVTLDLNGHTIDGLSAGGEGSDGVGVASNGHSHVTVVNGTVQQFFRGIALLDASGSVVRGITATENEQDAILLTGSDSVVERNLAFANSDDVEVGGAGFTVSGDRNQVSRNDAIDNIEGLVVVGHSVAVEANRAIGNRSLRTAVSVGFWLVGRDFVVRRNLAQANGMCGYRLEGARFQFMDNVSSDNFGEAVGFQPNGQEICLFDLDDSRLERNSASNSVSGLHMGCSGIYMDRSDGNVIEKNDASHNDFNGNGSGICLDRSNGNLATKNRASNNGDAGIRIRGDSSGNVLEKNFADMNGDDGLDTDSASTTLTDNSADRNGDLGIEAVPGVIDGGGNRARANGNPAQCTFVRCK
jgi:parallel beta-helix repeat protein